MTCDECGYPDHDVEGIQVTALDGQVYEFCSFKCLAEWADREAQE